MQFCLLLFSTGSFFFVCYHDVNMGVVLLSIAIENEEGSGRVAMLLYIYIFVCIYASIRW